MSSPREIVELSNRNFSSHHILQSSPTPVSQMEEKNQFDKDQQFHKINQYISISFLATGLFAIIGALYRWGDGPLFPILEDIDNSLFLADCFVTAPLSLIAALGYRKERRWSVIVGIFTAGVYIFGSALVYISVFLNGSPYPIKLLLPPVFGIGFSMIILIWSSKHFDKFK